MLFGVLRRQNRTPQTFLEWASKMPEFSEQIVDRLFAALRTAATTWMPAPRPNASQRYEDASMGSDAVHRMPGLVWLLGPISGACLGKRPHRARCSRHEPCGSGLTPRDRPLGRNPKWSPPAPLRPSAPTRPSTLVSPDRWSLRATKRSRAQHRYCYFARAQRTPAPQARSIRFYGECVRCS